MEVEMETETEAMKETEGEIWGEQQRSMRNNVSHLSYLGVCFGCVLWYRTYLLTSLRSPHQSSSGPHPFNPLPSPEEKKKKKGKGKGKGVEWDGMGDEEMRGIWRCERR